MFGSKNDFFLQKREALNKAFIEMTHILTLLDRDKEAIEEYREAFLFFIDNPRKFDGATIMRDLFMLKKDGNKLDIDAMLHDYEYITGANRNFIKKWNADLRYFNNMLLNGKGAQIFRFFLLMVTSVFFVPYAKIRHFFK